VLLHTVKFLLQLISVVFQCRQFLCLGGEPTLEASGFAAAFTAADYPFDYDWFTAIPVISPCD
jgi:hypothetical protein